MTRPCPECKSHNTRQTSKVDTAYCLSCYHQFRSVVKTKPEPVQVKLRERNKDVLKKKILLLEQQLQYYKQKLEG